MTPNRNTTGRMISSRMIPSSMIPNSMTTRPSRWLRITTLAAALLAGAHAPLTAAAPGLRAQPTPFSAGPLGAEPPPGWMLQRLPKVERITRFDVIDDAGTMVLRARSDNAAASLRHSLYADPKLTPILRWRWRTERLIGQADLTQKKGDDFPARLYVFFDRRTEQMSLKERTLFKLGQARFGNELPAAALCYVWDNRQPVDTLQDNAYTGFVKMVVVSSGSADLGRWVAFRRDVAADYRRAFGTEAPAIIGVAVSADTDNTGEIANTWFGDIRFESRDATPPRPAPPSPAKKPAATGKRAADTKGARS